jgi:hypothetical protein
MARAGHRGTEDPEAAVRAPACIALPAALRPCGLGRDGTKHAEQRTRRARVRARGRDVAAECASVVALQRRRRAARAARMRDVRPLRRERRLGVALNGAHHPHRVGSARTANGRAAFGAALRHNIWARAAARARSLSAARAHWQWLSAEYAGLLRNTLAPKPKRFDRDSPRPDRRALNSEWGMLKTTEIAELGEPPPSALGNARISAACFAPVD